MEQVGLGSQKYLLGPGVYRHIPRWKRQLRNHILRLRQDLSLCRPDDPVGRQILHDEKQKSRAMQILMAQTPLPKVLAELIVADPDTASGQKLYAEAIDQADICGAQQAEQQGQYWSTRIEQTKLRYWSEIGHVQCLAVDLITATYVDAQRHANGYFRLHPVTPVEVAQFRLQRQSPPRWVSWFYDVEGKFRNVLRQPPNIQWGFHHR